MEELRIPVFALAGNPNSGKTTLFNRLTGSSAEVGNWPGVTVERRTGTACEEDFRARIVDLPGIYSLTPYTPEEGIAGDFLAKGHPDAVINVVDAGNLERNLYLTTQLLETGVPVVIAMTMADVASRRGDVIDYALLQTLLGVSVIPVRASKGEGTRALLSAARRAAEKPASRRRPVFLAPGGNDPDREEAEARYRLIESILAKAVQRSEKGRGTTEWIDRIAAGRIPAIPVFFLIVLSVFLITFGPPGASLVRWMTELIRLLSAMLAEILNAAGTAPWLESLLLNGVLSGIGAVAAFLPQILLLFLLLSLLEDSGYMARAAFIMDAPMRKIGLSGRSFVPLLMGFGCTVPAVMGSRILESEKDRRLTILITPFLSCSAKLPVYALVAGVFFPGRQALVLFLLYSLGIAAGLGSAFLFKKSILKGEPDAFLMELPDYRMPTWDNIRRHVGHRIRDFLQRAGTTVFAATVVVWVLQFLSPDLRVAENSSLSLLAAAGRLIAPVFTLCGFADWRAAVALLSGLVAKESIVGSFGVLLAPNPAAALRQVFTPLSACSFLIFTLLYTPCAAALAAIRRETGSRMLCLFSAFWQFAAAWYASALFYQCALLLGRLFRA